MDVNESSLIVALDIGTTKIVVLIAEVLEGQVVKILSHAEILAKGTQKGVIINVKQTTSDIQNVIAKAEEKANCEVHRIFVNISGHHVNSMNSEGIVAIHQEVTKDDVEKVLQAAKAITLPTERQVIHAITQEFTVDNQTEVKEPTGMSALRLEAKVHMITGSVHVVKNIKKCVENVGLVVDGIVLNQIAAERSMLDEDRKKLGVCLIEIGGGVTNVVVFVEGILKHTMVLPIAGNQVTNDIAVAFNIPIANAEEVKINFGYAKKSLIPQDKVVETQSFNEQYPKRISITKLSEVIQFRYEEIFNLIKIELQRHGLFSKLGAGVILTGGASSTFGITELVKEVLMQNVMIHGPTRVENAPEIKNNPKYATSVGLLLYGHQQQSLSVKENVKLGYLAKMKDWIKENL